MPEQLRKSVLARSSPAGFAWYASNGQWEPAEHLLLLSEKLVDVAMGRCPRLMVFMPPRHGKSELISRYMPAWFLGRFPDRQVMLCGYADTFAASFGRHARDELKAHGQRLFGVTVNPETAGGSSWEVLGRKGIMVTAGVGGGITGRGADLLIIDDPLKNAQDAASQTIQALQHDWWRSTARTRLMPNAGVVLVMTRWHEADLAGNLIADWMDKDGDPWEIISLPALAEDHCSVSYPPSKTLDLGPDPTGRAIGEPLWPGSVEKPHFGLEALAQTARASGTYFFNAQYQQRPSSAEGNLFQRKHFRYYDKADSGLITLHRDEDSQVFDPGYAVAKFCTVDCAESEKKSSDYTVVATWIVTVERDLVLWDRQRFQFQGPDVKMLIRRVFFEQKPQFMAIENKSAGTSIIQELVREGLPIVPLNPDTDKVTRSLSMVARYEEHRVFHPRVSWVEDEWEPELLNFPHAKHDDQVDTAAYAGMQLPFLSGEGRARGVPGKRTSRSGGGTLTGGLLRRAL